MQLEQYKDIAEFLAENEALFFADNLKLKDGRPTPYFVNLGRINTGRTAPRLAELFARMMIDSDILKSEPVIIGPSYKGPPMAALTTAAIYKLSGLELGYDYDRKEAKTHGEASGQKNMFVTGALNTASSGIIIDDVATSMATKIELIEKLSHVFPELKIEAVVIAVDRQQTMPVLNEDGHVVLDKKGRDAVASFTKETGIPVYALAPIVPVIEYLYQTGFPVLINGQKQALSQTIKQEFDQYLATYGCDMETCR